MGGQNAREIRHYGKKQTGNWTAFIHIFNKIRFTFKVRIYEASLLKI